MSIQAAVEERKAQELQVQEANKKPSLATVIKQKLDGQTVEFKKLLPKNFDSEKFSRQVLSAIKSAPDLME